MITFEVLNLPANIDEDILKRELEKQIDDLPTLDSIRILRGRNGSNKCIALMQVDDTDYSAVTRIENTVIYICDKKISIRRKHVQKGEKNDSNTFMDENRNGETTLRRNAYRESRNSHVYDEIYEVDRYGGESYDDRRRDPSYGIPNRSMIYPAGFNTGVKNKVIEKYGKICHICGKEIRSESDITLDHIPPLAERFNEYEWKFPQRKRNEYFNDINFLKPAHRSCNSRTGSGGVCYDKSSLAAAMSEKHFSEGVAGWDKNLSEYNRWMRGKFQNEKINPY
ncbi:MAG: RNA-binding protein [Spirochaetes bacterium]|uniref:RNA-binding protein n=1 Tax=Candidatus Gallitreponema excrementavium TaxID=2840840 RepID=A0A9D9HMM5_9SPIR|nr:RNA-binding protein [Candidatus Gallitreponema excrementavium]